MGKHHGGHVVGVRRRTLIAVLSLMAPLTALAVAAPALATPKGPYAVFAQCPTGTSGVSVCTYAQTTGGEFKIGNTAVPINKTITLQGGGITDPYEEGSFFLVPAKNGESLSKTELKVPGGLLDLVRCNEISNFLERIACELVFENGTSGVTATTELVANASNPAIINLDNVVNGEKVGITLPVRVHLKNSLLGSGCYIGSEASPVELHLTTGATSPPLPNKSIKGDPGTLTFEEAVFVLSGNTLVDNAFSAPAAEGCGGAFSGLIDPILDAKIGLPAKAGSNTAILSGTTKVTSANAVIESEK
jgi:hypothetical protein